MKIGILTLPLETNYGGILQAYALQKTLRDMGHDVLTIDHHQPKRYKSFFHHLRGYINRCVQHYIYGKDISIYWNGFMPPEIYKRISSNTQPFIEKNIKKTQRILTTKLIEIEKEYNFDAYVVGSDQVWLPTYFPHTFLPFLHRDNVIKIVYAASSGRLSWMDFESSVTQARKFSRTFKAFSTREESLGRRASNVLQRDVVTVLDPTMLLEPQDYISVSEDGWIFPEKTLFTYVLDRSSEKKQIIEEIAKKYNLEIIEGNVKTDYVKKKGINLDDCVFPSVERWIQGISASSFVVTDSFHGTVFSILFNKPFISIGNARRGLERFDSLLRMFNLHNRLVCSLKDVVEKETEMIDWNFVNAKLSERRKKSLEFLSNNL